MNTSKDQVLKSMIRLLKENREALIHTNQIDLDAYSGGEQAMYDRLIINDKKVDGMIQSVQTILDKPDPVDVQRYHFQHPKGMTIENRTAPFGTILIIYESRPDVTIEAAVLAFKAGNKILLKGGKEAKHSNLHLVELWHQALKENDFSTDRIQYLNFDRTRTQEFLKSPDQPLDLIVPRGGEKLIRFVKEQSTAPVLVSGRGNNFLYIHPAADWEKVIPIVLNAKTQKISACNALDKILVDQNFTNIEHQLSQLIQQLQDAGVEVIVDSRVKKVLPDLEIKTIDSEAIWHEEFLAMKIVIGLCDDLPDGIQKINQYSGGHSASILTEDMAAAKIFMAQVDAAAVYHNASTRFTDGGEFGLGAELAISTDKLHHRGPLGLEHLVSNKWYVFGNGTIR